MAFDGSGNFVRLFNWVTDKINGVDITSSRVDSEDSGFAAGLSLCVTRDGQGKMTADFLPSIDNTSALGSVSFRWATLVATALKTTASAIQGLGPVSGAFQDMTPDTGTFTITMTGCTGAITATASWFRIGKLAFLTVPAMSGTSNATTLTWTGIPAAIQSASVTNLVPLAACTNGGASVNTVDIFIGSVSGTLTARIAGGASGFTASGTKGTAGFTIPLSLI